MARRATLGALVIFVGLGLGAKAAYAVCCVCQAQTPPNTCSLNSVSSSCDNCAAQCASVSGMMLACCPGGGPAESCQLLADSCGLLNGFCFQTASGRDGFCQGTCLGPTFTPIATPTPTATRTPTTTPTITQTATVTHTRTVTPTRTLVPNGGACRNTADCVSGNFCVDDTCCAEPACPPGQSCDNPGNAGVCSQDPSQPAPVLSRGSVLATVILLLALGGVAVRRRQRGA